jgi:hypothetical protein
MLHVPNIHLPGNPESAWRGGLGATTGLIRADWSWPDEFPDWLVTPGNAEMRFTQAGLYLAIAYLPVHVGLNSAGDWFGNSNPAGWNDPTGDPAGTGEWPEGVHIAIRSSLHYGSAAVIGT